ncbi:MAG: hypothetical protein K0R50_4204 [Eubacterium sp.]|nr:hypothetical protein [Eubacterium sp.]
MEKLVAYCGINCATCPLYIATKTEDISMKRELAEKWEKIYNRSFNIEDMKCFGCKSGKKFFLSDKCNITQCNNNKGIHTCKQCANSPCQRINDFYEWQKDNKTDVEFI